MFVHVDDFKFCPGPQDISWVPGVPTAKSLCANTVAFRLGSHVSDITPDPSVDVSDWDITKELDGPFDITGNVRSPFYYRQLDYQDSRFHSILASCTQRLRTGTLPTCPTSPSGGFLI